jgi:hypothetical protein
MNYTYEQVLACEVAHELINSHIADCSAEIGDEEKKAEPDSARLEELRKKVIALVLERGRMQLTDDAAIAAIISKYRRAPVAKSGNRGDMAFMEEALALANPTPEQVAAFATYLQLKGSGGGDS